MAFSCCGGSGIFITNFQWASPNSYDEHQPSATSILYCDQPFTAWEAKAHFEKNVRNHPMGKGCCFWTTPGFRFDIKGQLVAVGLRETLKL